MSGSILGTVSERDTRHNGIVLVTQVEAFGSRPYRIVERTTEWSFVSRLPGSDILPRGSPAALTVRSVTFADLGAVAPVFAEYRRVFLGESDLRRSRRFLSQRLARRDSVIFAVFEGKTALAFSQLFPLFSSLFVERQWLLSDLYVLQSHRRHGIGRGLAKACIQFAKQTDSRGILFQIPSSEKQLATFYSDLGFVRDSRYELYSCDTEK